MRLEPYRAVLAIPGVARLTAVALLARVPVTAAGVVLTLHVVLTLGHGYGAAGLVGAVATIGTAIGAPLLGRIVDRQGLRGMLVLATVAEGVFWSVAPWLPYRVLLVTAFIGGVLALPVFTVVRQSLAALVPLEQRHTAYAVDSISVEMSFMIGPMLGVLAATRVSTTAAMLGVGATIVCSGVALYTLNPPIRGNAPADIPDSAGGTDGGTAGSLDGPGNPDGAARQSVPQSVRAWLSPTLASVLVATAACTIILAGTDVAIVASLQSTDHVSWTGVVMAVWALASIVGGFIYGALRRGVSALTVAMLLGVCTMPVGVLGGTWWVLCLTIVPAGMLCAPTLASLADAVSRLAPETMRGLVMGLHGSALTVGLAIGAPLSGAVVDSSSPAWGFAAVGGLGAVLALSALLLRNRRSHPASLQPRAQPPLATASDRSGM